MVFARINEKLTDFLIDSELQPEEMIALLEFADREGMAREVVAAHVQDRISAAGLVSKEPVSGATLEQRLLSSSWVHPSRREQPLIGRAAQPARGMTARWVLAATVLTAIAVGAWLFSNRARTVPPPPDAAGEGEVSPPPPVEATPEPQIENTPTPQEVAPAALDRPSAVLLRTNNSDPPAAPPVEEPVEAVVSAADRQAAASELEEIRSLSAADPAGAIERAQQLDSRLAAHPREFADERLALADIRSRIQAAVMERKFEKESQRIQEESDRERLQKWEQRLAQIELLSRQKNFSGAKDLANQLLAEPDVPEPIAARARELADEAVANLQAIFTGAKVKSKTKRTPDPPH
jgi:hypothetical protein